MRSKEEKYTTWLQANLPVRRLAAVAVFWHFFLYQKIEKDQHWRFFSGFGQSAVGQHGGTTWDVEVCCWEASSWPRPRCVIWPAWLRHKKARKHLFLFLPPDGCMKWTLWFFTKHSISLSGHTLRWSCSLLLRRFWKKKKCHFSLSQANNKRWVPAAASQLPNGRALLSTHLLQLWVRTLQHGSLAVGGGAL